MEATKHKSAIAMAMREPETFVLKVVYLDSNGSLTERVVSPIRYLTATRLSVYCLGREAVRTLVLGRIMQMKFVLASDVLLPEAIRNLCIHHPTLAARRSTETKARHHDSDR